MAVLRHKHTDHQRGVGNVVPVAHLQCAHTDNWHCIWSLISGPTSIQTLVCNGDLSRLLLDDVEHAVREWHVGLDNVGAVKGCVEAVGAVDCVLRAVCPGNAVLSGGAIDVECAVGGDCCVPAGLGVDGRNVGARVVPAGGVDVRLKAHCAEGVVERHWRDEHCVDNVYLSPDEGISADNVCL